MEATIWTIVVITAGVAFFLGALAGDNHGFNEGLRKMQSEATLLGYGEYCAGDGRFAWVGECGE